MRVMSGSEANISEADESSACQLCQIRRSPHLCGLPGKFSVFTRTSYLSGRKKKNDLHKVI